MYTMKVCYIILTCEKFLNTRASWQKSTFLQDVDKKDIYFISGVSSENVYGWNTPDHYEACPMKYMMFIKNMDIQYDWYIFIDDDTFMYPSRVRDCLAAFDERKKYYIGSERTEREFVYMSGGAGFCLSNALYQEIKRYVDDKTLNELYYNYNGDVTVGYWISKMNDILYVTHPLFSADPPRNEEELKNFISFHYLKTKEDFERCFLF